MKRFWAVFATAALIAVFLALPRAEARPSIHFTAINDQLLPLSTNTIPIVRSGSIYIPSGVLDRAGVSVASRTSETLVLTGRGKTLTFNLTAGNAHDAEATYSAQAVSRSGLLYVPAYFICQYFGMQYSYLATDYGTIVRIKNANANLNDNAFTRQNTKLMQQYYESYTNQTIAPVPTTAPPTATAAPEPSAAVSAQPTSTPAGPTLRPTPTPSVSPSESPQIVTLTMGVCLTGQSDGDALLDVLDSRRNVVCIFFAPDQLAEQSDLVRRAVGSGYGIGLYLTNAAPDPMVQLKAGNRMLSEIARTTTILVACPSFDQSQKADLTRKGYVVFQSSELIGRAEQTASQCRNRVQRLTENVGGTVRLLFGDTVESKNALSSLMNVWRGEEYKFRRFSETSR